MWHDILFLGVGGFLLGSLLYIGWYTTRYEPEAKPGYLVMGIGVVMAVTTNVWLEFQTDASYWFLGVTLIGYALVAVGLTLIVRARRKEGGLK
jgi:uncharacterized protein (DUF983 family)